MGQIKKQYFNVYVIFLEKADNNKDINCEDTFDLSKNIKDNPITSSTTFPLGDNMKWSLISKKKSQGSLPSKTEHVSPSSMNKQLSSTHTESIVPLMFRDRRISSPSISEKHSCSSMKSPVSTTFRRALLLIKDKRIPQLPKKRQVLPLPTKPVVPAYSDKLVSMRFRINLDYPSFKKRRTSPRTLTTDRLHHQQRRGDHRSQ